MTTINAHENEDLAPGPCPADPIEKMQWEASHPTTECSKEQQRVAA